MIVSEHPEELVVVLASPSRGDDMKQLMDKLTKFEQAASGRLVYAVNMVPLGKDVPDPLSELAKANRTDLCESRFPR